LFGTLEGVLLFTAIGRKGWRRVLSHDATQRVNLQVTRADCHWRDDQGAARAAADQHQGLPAATIEDAKVEPVFATARFAVVFSSGVEANGRCWQGGPINAGQGADALEVNDVYVHWRGFVWRTGTADDLDLQALEIVSMILSGSWQIGSTLWERQGEGVEQRSRGLIPDSR
jgi:hypothetical protein